MEKLLRQADTHGAEMTITIEVIVPGGALPSNLCVQGPTPSALALTVLFCFHIGPDEGEAHQALPAYAAGERSLTARLLIATRLSTVSTGLALFFRSTLPTLLVTQLP